MAHASRLGQQIINAPVDPDNDPREDTDGMVIEQVTPVRDIIEKEFDKVQENTFVQHVQARDSQ